MDDYFSSVHKFAHRFYRQKSGKKHVSAYAYPYNYNGGNSALSTALQSDMTELTSSSLADYEVSYPITKVTDEPYTPLSTMFASKENLGKDTVYMNTAHTFPYNTDTVDHAKPSTSTNMPTSTIDTNVLQHPSAKLKLTPYRLNSFEGFPVYTQETLLPYADEQGQSLRWWSGYYFSRPWIKILERMIKNSLYTIENGLNFLAGKPIDTVERVVEKYYKLSQNAVSQNN